MKKILKSILCITLICTLIGIFPVTAAEEKLFPESYKVILCEASMTGIAGGEMSTLPTSPYEKDGKLMLPVRYLFENSGYTVSWDNGKVSLNGEKTVEITQGEKTAVVDGSQLELSVPVENKNGTLMISEEICEALSYTYKKASNGIFVIYEGKYSADYESNLLKLQGIYISASGSTSGSAQPNKPIKNIPMAVELAKGHVELYGSKYPVNIYVKGGTYKFSETLTFDSSFFANADIKGVFFKGYDGEAIFTGATELDETMLKPVTDAFTLARIPQKARGHVAYLDLNEVGIANLFSPAQTSLPYVYVNDVLQIESRWPNKDWALVGSVPISESIGIAEDNVRNWTTATEAKITGFMRNNYEQRTGNITAVDPDKKTITYDGGVYFTPDRVNSRYYVRNLLEEVDLPGEWFVDRNAGILYFYPPYSLKDAKLEICTLQEKNMIDISNCRNIAFDKITFEKGGASAIYMPDASNISITNCKFQFFQGINTIHGNPGYTSVNPGDNLVIDGNEAWMLGRTFTDLRTGNIDTLKNGNSKITNNRIMAAGITNQYGTVINTGTNWPDRTASCGWLIANNLIQDTEGSSAINPAGIDILTTENECVNIGNSIDDGGVIYIGRAASLYNTEISYNYIHHLNRDHSYSALYNDDGYSGANWHHNVAYDAGQLTILGSGMDMFFNNNLAIDMKRAGGVGSRMTWSEATFGPNGALINEVKTALSKTPEYAQKFPELAEALTRTPYFAPWNSTVYGNVGINNSGLDGCSATSQVQSEFETYGGKYYVNTDGEKVDVTGKNATPAGNPNYVYSDELFVDAKNQNWNLKPDTQIVKDFPELAKIDMEKIGISEGYEHLLNLSKDFKLKSPYNGESGIQPKEITFSWDPVKGASKYRLVVATDPELQNVMYDGTQPAYLNNNNCTLTALSLDTVYYWRVYAIGLARQDSFVVANSGAPYSFKTASKQEVNRERLKLAIDGLKGVLAEIEEGGYEYEEEFFTRADELLTRAEEIHKRSIDQDERDKMEEEIYNLVNISPYYMLVEFENARFLYKPDSVWTSNRDHMVVSYNGNEVTISSTKDPSEKERLEAYVADDTAVDKILCMQVNIEKMQRLENNESGYMGYSFKVNPQARTSDYQLFVFKGWITEFQKKGMCIEMPNFNSNVDNEWIDVELGSLNCPGGTLTYAAVNGAVIWAGLDNTPTRVKEGGQFEVWKNQYDTKMRPMEKVPEKTSLIKRIYENFENPESEDHLEAMLVGMGTLINMDNTLYKSLDKDKFARNLYPHIEGGKIKIANNDISDYKAKVWEYAILEGYNQNQYDYVLKNKVQHIYPEYIELEKLDEEGRCFKAIMDERFLDGYIARVNEKAMGGECKSFEELRVRYAKAIFTVAINGCSGGIYGGDTSYMKRLITKTNADYIGIDIDAYFALDDTGRDKINNYIGRSGVSAERTLEEIVDEINTMAAELQ